MQPLPVETKPTPGALDPFQTMALAGFVCAFASIVGCLLHLAGVSAALCAIIGVLTFEVLFRASKATLQYFSNNVTWLEGWDG